MSTSYITKAEIVSPLGIGLATNFKQVSAGVSALQEHPTGAAKNDLFCALIDQKQLDEYDDILATKQALTKLERMSIVTGKRLLDNSNLDPKDLKHIFILCTTKGNIDLLFKNGKDIPSDRILFSQCAKAISQSLGFANEPIVISNACISGVEGILIGRQLIEAGFYQRALVLAADLVTDFTISGFYSLNAYAKGRCRPFDQHRTGVNLGECCAGVVLSALPEEKNSLKILGGTSSNDANHMTAPSKEARGLSKAIKDCLSQSTQAVLPDFISAHGTGTRYNDAMESLAFYQSGLEDVPYFSLKGVYGHTLGAAGLLETAIATEALKQNTILPSLGFESAGEDIKMQPTTALAWTPMKSFLKTASGFGGGNACLMVEKSAA